MGENSKKHYFCLNARQFTTGLHCVETNDCFKPEQSVCLHPSLDEQSRLFRIVHNGPKDVIFVGHPLLLHQSISLTDYHPRINIFLLYQVPRVAETFLLYFISLSFALGLLNSVPAYFLDGQWIITALIDFFFRTWSEETRNKLTSTVLAMGSILLLLNVVLGLYSIMNT
jgi:S2P endopeptidase